MFTNKDNLNKKAICYFEFAAVCRMLIENYTVFQKITELKKIEKRPPIIEALRRDSFYVFMLSWVEIFCKERGSLSSKKIFGDCFNDIVLGHAKISNDDWDSLKKNAKIWRNKVIAHFDLEKSKNHPKKESLKSHLKIVIIAYKLAYKKIDEMPEFNRKAFIKATYVDPDNILKSYQEAAERLKQSLATLAEK